MTALRNGHGPTLRILGWALLTAAALCPTSTVSAAPVRIVLSCNGDRPIGPAAVTASSADTDPVQADLPEGGRELVLDLQPGRAWTVSVAADGLWAAPRTVWVADEPDELSIDLVPVGLLRGHLLAPDDSPRPGSVRATFQSAVDRPGQESATASQVVVCPIDEDRSFECELPAGALDIKLRIPGYASTLLWDQRVRADQVLDLGDLALIQGGSVLGWVTAPSGDLARIAVRLVPARPHEMPLDSPDARATMRTSTATPDARGCFHFTGVPPGVYEVEASHPGLVTATSGAFTLGNGLEATLADTLELAAPVPLRLQLDPPADPLGRPWRVQLLERGTAGQPGRLVASTEADRETGDAVIEAAPPGAHMVQIRDTRRGYWYQEDVEVSAGLPPIEITVPVLKIVGWVGLGDHPLRAAIRFTTLQGRGGNIWLQSDENGVFGGALPGPGTWQPTVRFPDGRDLTPREALDLEAAEPGETVEVELRLPDTRIEGVVVDTSGDPVPDAWIMAIPELVDTSTLGSSETSSSSDGSFRIEGLPPARLWLTASRDAASSAKLELQLEEGHPITDLRLVLRPKHHLRGRVVSDLGPVPGARIKLIPDLTGGAWALAVDGTTQIDGTFDLEIPAEHPAGDLQVFALGHAAALRRVNLADDTPLLITLDRAGGRLHLTWSLSRPGARSPSVAPMLRYAGTNQGVITYTAWIRAHPDGIWSRDGGRGTAVIPQMPAGPYQACMAAAEPDQADPEPAPGPRLDCVEGVLPPSGDLVLTLE